MAKEQAVLESMEEVDMGQFKPEAIKETAESEKVPEITETKAPEEKPKAAKKAAVGFKSIRYIGTNPSYTIGRHRFQENEVQAVEKELAEYALRQSCFEEA